MKAFQTIYKDNFSSYESFSVRELKLEEYADILPITQHLQVMFGATEQEFLNAVRELRIGNEEILDVEYFPAHDYPHARLLKRNAAERTEYDKYGHRFYTKYSAYVVPNCYKCYYGEVIRYFLERQYPDIFLNPSFFVNVCETRETETLTFSEAIAEFGDITLREARFAIPAKVTLQYPRQQSKFKMYGYFHSTPMEYEIYLETDRGSLYIPFRAIVEQNFSLIEQRQRDYFSNYYRKNPDKLSCALDVLQSPEAQLLKELLTTTE